MTPEDQAWITEQQRRLSGVPTLAEQLYGASQQPSLNDAWRSIAALNSANDTLRWELGEARGAARRWQIGAYLMATLVLINLLTIWCLANR